MGIVSWRLSEVMDHNGILTVAELRSRLQRVGYDISLQQLSRIARSRPRTVSLEFLAALLTVLGCKPQDLIAFDQNREPAG